MISGTKDTLQERSKAILRERERIAWEKRTGRYNPNPNVAFSTGADLGQQLDQLQIGRNEALPGSEASEVITAYAHSQRPVVAEPIPPVRTALARDVLEVPHSLRPAPKKGPGAWLKRLLRIRG